MDKQPVGQLPDLKQSNNDDEIMIITDNDHNQLKKEKISDFITDLTSVDVNNNLIKGSDGKLYVSKSISASEIEGIINIDNLPEIPSTKLENTGVTPGYYRNPANVQVNSSGQITSISDGTGGGVSDITPYVTNCLLGTEDISFTKQDYEMQSYVNLGCTVSETNVVSGFSQDNYILLNKLAPNDAEFTFSIPFELSALAGIQTLIAINNYDNCICLNNGVLALRYNGNQLNATGTLLINTAYTLNFVKTSSDYTVQIKSEDDEEFATVITLPSDIDFFGGKSITLGSDKTHYLSGTIDLANLTITSGSAAYWDITTLSNFQTVTLTGNLDCLMPNGRNSDMTLNNENPTLDVNTTFLLNNSTGDNKTVLIKDNGELMIRDSYVEKATTPDDIDSSGVWFDTANNYMKEQQLQLPNIINSGCLFVNGVASNFSQENFLELPSGYNLGNSWSISLPVNIVLNSSNQENVIIGDYTKNEEGEIIPNNLAVVYDGNTTVTVYLRRNDVFACNKQIVESVAYEVTYQEQTGYVSSQGETGAFVASGIQIYSDTTLSEPLTTAGENEWQYTGNHTDNVSTVNGYTKISGTIFVPSGTQVYKDANLTDPDSLATGTDWVYTGATSISMIGTLQETVSAGAYTLELNYDGENYSLGSQTLANADFIKENFNIYIGSAPSAENAFFNSTIDIGQAEFSFWTWNGVSDVEPNFTPVGDIQLDNGVLSGFSSTAYATIPQAFNPGSNPWEMILLAQKTSSITGVIFNNNATSSDCSINIYWGSVGVGMSLSSNGTSYDIANGQTSTSQLELNTPYYIKLSWDTTKYVLSHSLTGENNSFIEDVSVESTAPVFNSNAIPLLGRSYLGSSPFLGSIDLKGCSISINGEPWWQWNGVNLNNQYWNSFVGCKIGAVSMTQETVQPNIGITGDLTNTNGVLSGFNVGVYGLTNITLPSTITSYEFVTKITTGSDITGHQGILANSITNIATPQIIISNGTLTLNHPANASTWVDVREFEVQANTTYWVRATWDGSTASLYYKTSDAEDYILTGTVAAVTINWVEQIEIGCDIGAGPFLGSIDLNESYININGELWWRWNGYTSTTNVNTIEDLIIDYPLNLLKSTDSGIGGESTPIGQPIITLSNEIGSNEIWLEGATVSRTLYARLFKVYGTTYGSGDGSTTFQLPDFRNRAVWGADSFGYLSAGLPNITGSVLADFISPVCTGAFYASGNGTRIGGVRDRSTNGFAFQASRSSSIYGSSDTVQPSSIKVRVKTRYR